MAENKALARIDEAGKQIDKVLKDCLPISSKVAENVCDSLSIAKAIYDLKSIFMQSAEIKPVIEKMQNVELGFMTDRTPAIIAKNQREGKFPNRPYTYEEIVNALVVGLLKGYRLTGNEINIIAGKFYAAKAGNYNRVVASPGINAFQYNNAPVALVAGGKMAQVKCWASWEVDGKKRSIGVDENDQCTFQVRVNFGMGEDAVVGKAHSKLFKRVLERISGQVAPESTDLSDIPEAQFTTEPVDQAPAGSAVAPGMEIYGGKPSPDAGSEPEASAEQDWPAIINLGNGPALEEEEKLKKRMAGAGGPEARQGNPDAGANDQGPDNDRGAQGPWDPLKEPLRKRYDAAKIDTIEHSGRYYGVDVSRLKTGREKHIAVYKAAGIEIPKEENAGAAGEAWRKNTMLAREKLFEKMRETRLTDDRINALDEYLLHKVSVTKKAQLAILVSWIDDFKTFLTVFSDWFATKQADGGINREALEKKARGLRAENQLRWNVITGTIQEAGGFNDTRIAKIPTHDLFKICIRFEKMDEENKAMGGDTGPF